MDNDKYGNVQVLLRSQNGQVVDQWQFEKSYNTFEKTVEIGAQLPGLYVVDFIFSDRSKVSKKILKQ